MADPSPAWVETANKLIAKSRKKLVKEEHLKPKDEKRARYVSVLDALKSARKERTDYRQVIAYLVSIIIDENLMMFAESTSPEDALEQLLEEIVEEEIQDSASPGHINEWLRIQNQLIPALRANGMPLIDAIEAFYGNRKSKLRMSATHLAHIETQQSSPAEKQAQLVELWEKVVDPGTTVKDFERWSFAERDRDSRRKQVEEVRSSLNGEYAIVTLKLPIKWLRALEIKLGEMLPGGSITDTGFDSLVDMLYTEKPLPLIKRVTAKLGMVKSDLLDKYYETKNT